MNTQKKELQKKGKAKSRAYHGIFMLKSNVDTPIELDTIMCSN